MTTLKFDVNQQTIIRTDHERLVNSSHNIINARFRFSGELWEDYCMEPKFVLFKDSWNNKTRVRLGRNHECRIPNNVLAGSFFRLAVYAGDLIVTNYLNIPLSTTMYNDTGDCCDKDFHLFNDIFTQLRSKYDDLVLEDSTLYCYGDGELLKIINFDDLILSNTYTRNYIDDVLATKYDDFKYSDGNLLCYIDGDLRKRVPIIAVENYYTKQEIDDRFDEVNHEMLKFFVDGEISSDEDGVYLVLINKEGD